MQSGKKRRKIAKTQIPKIEEKFRRQVKIFGCRSFWNFVKVWFKYFYLLMYI